MELIRENIVLNKHIGSEKNQLLLEGDIIVPDTKPDILSILKVGAKLFMGKAAAGTGRISFSGRVALDVLYLAKSTEEEGGPTIHSISTHANIDDFLNVEGVAAGMWVDVDMDLTNIDHHIINDRKLGYRALVDITAKAWENETFDVVKAIKDLPDTQQKMLHFTPCNITNKQNESFTIRDEIVLPPNKPAIGEMLHMGVVISDRDINLSEDGRIDVSAVLAISPLYKGAEADSTIEFADFELPFSGSLEIEGDMDATFVDTALSLGDYTINITQDEAGEDRVISIEATINADVKAFKVEEHQVLADAYSLEQSLDLHKKQAEYTRLICRNKNQFNTKEIITLEDSPEILQILQVDGIARLDDIRVLEDKVIVEGAIEATMLYVANCDDNPLYSYTAHIPIKQVIEAKGTMPDMNANIKHNIDSISFNMFSGKEAELRFGVSFDALITATMPINFVEDIDFNELDKAALDALPSMVVLVAEKGDNLWSISKEYNADLEELAEINNIDKTAELVAGQRLLVVKKVSED